MALTATGTLLFVLLLLPNWPLLFLPQAVTVPSEHKAKWWESPAATAMTVLPASTPVTLTATGTLLFVLLLLPK